jgi:hypothetical protein
MTGIVDFRTELLDENGNPITALNPLPTTGGGGGGGALLADVLLTDATSALFVGRDNGTTFSYFNLNTNAVYTPSGTIQAAGGGGGGGGSLLADVLLTDDDGALFVGRDNGTAITYFNLNTNALYTPVGTIKAAGLTDAQLRAAPVGVVDVANEASQQEMVLLLTRMLNYFNAPQGYDKSLQRGRVTAVVETGNLGTISTVTTVATVTNLTNITGSIGNYQANQQVWGQNQASWAALVRARIT